MLNKCVVDWGAVGWDSFGFCVKTILRRSGKRLKGESCSRFFLCELKSFDLDSKNAVVFAEGSVALAKIVSVVSKLPNERSFVMEIRRDSLGRILRKGESQRSDGRYCFKYVDAKGETRYAYSRTLTTHDPIPLGASKKPCLRELEKKIQHELFEGVSSKKMTVFQLASRYATTRVGVRETTKAGYKTVLNFLAKDPFGKKQVSEVTTLEAREWLAGLQQNKGKSYSAIHVIRGVLRPAFSLAVMDGFVARNPFDFELAQVLVNDSVKRTAITPKQERLFLEFVKNDKHFSRYYDAMFLLFATGLRISEFCGLTVADLDFEEGHFDVRRQLQRTSDMRYCIVSPKSKAGERRLPMSGKVKEAFLRVVATRKEVDAEPVVDGVSGFLFLDRSGEKPEVALHWEKRFSNAVKKYNRIFREPLPKITPHVCRHTYCSRLARNCVSPSRMQYLMGHSSSEISLNVYTHMHYEDVKGLELDVD